MKQINMEEWVASLIGAACKKPMPVLSFPSIQLMDIGVNRLISSAQTQAEGMRLIAQRTDAAAALSMMDLSVEAEAFGSAVRFSDDEVPTVTGRIVSSADDARALAVPPVSAGRCGIYVDAIRIAAETINDRPVFAGTIGPFSLAGRLMDVSEIMLNCYDDPEMVHITLDKTTRFIIDYIMAYKQAGANGVVIAEPLAGILSPGLADEFSSGYIKRIVDAVQDDDFIAVYHNCGNNTPLLIDSILNVGAGMYHFGNAVDMRGILELMPPNIIAMGNIDPVSQFRNGTPGSVRQAALGLLEQCGGYKNFIISSGCDIPPLSKWENIDAFFTAVGDFYHGRG